MLDVSPDDVTRVDASDMLGIVLRQPEQFERAVESARAVRLALPRAPTRVVVTGLGGSAMGGDLVAAWAEREGRAPVLVNRTYSLPKWVDADTLVLAVSYSGNTEETLAAFTEAKQRGAMLAAVSTGGKLEEFARATSAPFVKIEPGLQPRAALPRTFVPQVAILAAAGVLPDPWAELQATSAALRALATDLAPDASAGRNEAKRVALAVKDTVAAVYGADAYAAVARRWANNLNENGKVLAWWGVMPEMNHNEIVGWGGDDDLDRFTAVMLRHPDEHAQVRQRFDFTAKVIQERGGRVVQVPPREKGFLPGIFTTIMTGDAASVYLAVLRGQDPTPVKVIGDLKRKVGESGFGAELQRKLR